MSKTAATAEAPAEAAPKNKSLGTKIKIAAIVATIMIVELVAMMFLLPRGAESAAAPAAESHEEEGEHKSEHGGHGSHAKEAKGHGHGHGKADEQTAQPTKGGNESEEIDLGEFSVTSYQPAASTTLFISFHLFGTLQHKNNEELLRRLEDNKHRIRDNIIVIIRSAEITDLTDAGLGLIKRRILETTNKTLGKPLLQAVVFSDFSFVEQ